MSGIERRPQYRGRTGGRTALSILVVVMAVLPAGCSGPQRRPVPAEWMDAAQIPGLPGVRAWGDELSEPLQADMAESIRQERAARGDGLGGPADYHVLAISGGGASGAFGAGFLCGWTQAGNRPQFKLVTGVSTGALIAPAAFLGPPYDEQIRQIYTETRTRDVFNLRNALSWLWSESLADSRPLERLIHKHLDQKVFEAVAAEHRRGRRLYVGTTNLDAERFVIWNMGAIAASGRPDAIDLFRNILLASSSIPVAFPPVYLGVEANGQSYDEMHVDGGTIAQVFFYEFTLDPNSVLRRAEAAASGSQIHLYVLYNGKLDPTPRAMPREIPKIVERSLGALMRARAIGDIYRIYLETKRNHIHFRYLDMPVDYVPQGREAFDPQEMRRLFQVGYDMALSSPPWQSTPPGFSEDPLP